MKTVPFKKIPLLFLAAAAVGLLVLMAAVNYTIDPGNLFKAGREGSDELLAVRFLSEGTGAENLDNYDERLVKRMLIPAIGKKDVLALGSSRAALITCEMAGTDSFFNLSVAGAMLQEAVATYGLYHEQYGAPERVIISVDPWFFCENHDSSRFYAALADGFYRYATSSMGMKLDAEDYTIDNFYIDPTGRTFFELPFSVQKQLLSVTYFQSAAKELLSGTGLPVSATDKHSGQAGILRADGSYSYPAEYCNVTADAVATRGNSTAIIGEGAYDLENGRQQEIFRAFLESLVSDGVEVQLLLVPVNPVTYERSVETGIPMGEIESLVKDIASEYGAAAVGSYDVAAMGGSLESFYDAYHYRPELVAELVAMAGEVQ